MYLEDPLEHVSGYLYQIHVPRYIYLFDAYRVHVLENTAYVDTYIYLDTRVCSSSHVYVAELQLLHGPPKKKSSFFHTRKYDSFPQFLLLLLFLVFLPRMFFPHVVELQLPRGPQKRGVLASGDVALVFA